MSSLSPRAQALLDRMTVAADAEPTLDSRYLVKGWLDRGAASVLYGEPGAGKTFLALDLSYHVAAGRDWHGARVNGGPVLYIIAEGGRAVLNRVAALQDREGVPLWALPASVDFCRSTDDATALLAVLTHLKAHHGDYALIVIDTLARAMGAGDENSAPDMGAMVRTVDLIREKTGAHVMLVHHCGKDQARGARGHSSLRAAVDTEIELSKDGDVILAEARKQRDMAVPPPFAYRLREVELGRDSDGDPVTTCVVEPTEAPAKRVPLGQRERRILDALREYVADHGKPNPAGTGWPEAGAFQCVPLEEFIDFAKGREPADAPKERRRTAKLGLRSLHDKGTVGINNGHVWEIPGKVVKGG